MTLRNPYNRSCPFRLLAQLLHCRVYFTPRDLSPFVCYRKAHAECRLPYAKLSELPRYCILIFCVYRADYTLGISQDKEMKKNLMLHDNGIRVSQSPNQQSSLPNSPRQASRDLLVQEDKRSTSRLSFPVYLTSSSDKTV